MIYVVDNGMDYSDHGIYFNDLPDDMPVEDAIWLLENVPGQHSRHSVVLVAKDPALYGLTPEHAFDEEWFYVGNAERDDEWLRRCPKDLLLSLIDHGIEEVKGWLENAPYNFKPTHEERIIQLVAFRAWAEARP